MRKLLSKPFNAVWRWIQCLVSRKQHQELQNIQDSPRWVCVRNGGDLPLNNERVKVYLRVWWSGVYQSDYYQIDGLWHTSDDKPVIEPESQVLEWETKTKMTCAESVSSIDQF